jgi:hypothetical protein
MPKYLIRLIRWIIREVQILEIRKRTCRVLVIEIANTKQVLL